VNGSLYDLGSQVGVGAAPDGASLKLDVAGSVGATAFCDELGQHCFTPANVALSGSTVGGSGLVGRLAKFIDADTL